MGSFAQGAARSPKGEVMSSYAKFCLILAGLSAGSAACTTLHVTTDVNPNFSVANCHTYSLRHASTAAAPMRRSRNPLNADRLRAAIEGNMAARGVTKAADKASADCVIGYAMGTRQVFNDYYAGWGPGWGVGYGWGRGGYGWGGGWGYDGPWVENETRIVVDMFDARAHKADLARRGQPDHLGPAGPERRGQDQRGDGGDIRASSRSARAAAAAEPRDRS